MDEFGEDVALTLVRILDVAFDDRHAVIVHILDGLIGEVDEGNGIEIVLRFVETCNVARVV